MLAAPMPTQTTTPARTPPVLVPGEALQDSERRLTAPDRRPREPVPFALDAHHGPERLSLAPPLRRLCRSVAEHRHRDHRPDHASLRLRARRAMSSGGELPVDRLHLSAPQDPDQRHRRRYPLGRRDPLSAGRGRDGPDHFVDLHEGLRRSPEHARIDRGIPGQEGRGADRRPDRSGSRQAAALAAVDRTSRYYVEVTDACTACGRCRDICLYDVIDFSDGRPVIDLERCDGCGLCERSAAARSC